MGASTLRAAAAVLAMSAAAACGPSPAVQCAHLLERAASWAAAARMTAETTAHRTTPSAFAGDLRQHAVKDLDQTAASIDALDVDPTQRAAASALCRQLARKLDTASDQGEQDGLLRLETELRTMATRLRSSAAEATAESPTPPPWSAR